MLYCQVTIWPSKYKKKHTSFLLQAHLFNLYYQYHMNKENYRNGRILKFCGTANTHSFRHYGPKICSTTIICRVLSFHSDHDKVTKMYVFVNTIIDLIILYSSVFTFLLASWKWQYDLETDYCACAAIICLCNLEHSIFLGYPLVVFDINFILALLLICYTSNFILFLKIMFSYLC